MVDVDYPACPIDHQRRLFNRAKTSSIQKWSMAVSALFVLATTKFPPLSGALLLAGGVITFVPVRGHFICDKIWLACQNRRLRRYGGYYYRGTRSVENWLVAHELLSYPLSHKQLGVLRNQRRSKRFGMIVLQLDSLPGSTFSDTANTKRQAVDLNQALTDIGRLVSSRVKLFSLVRPVDPTEMDEYVSSVSNASEEIDTYLRLLRAQTSDRLFCLAVEIPIGRKDQEELKAGRADNVSACRTALQVVRMLKNIGVTAHVMEAHELAVLRQVAFEPTTAESAWRTLGMVKRGRDSSLASHMTEQIDLSPTVVQVGHNWMRVGNSVHAVMETTRVRAKAIPPGALTELMDGISYWCIASLQLEYESNRQARFSADMRRRWDSGNLQSRLKKGRHTTSRIREKVSDSEKTHDRLDSTDVVVRSTIRFVISASSLAELDNLCQAATDGLRVLGLVLKRIDGEFLQLSAFESAISTL